MRKFIEKMRTAGKVTDIDQHLPKDYKAPKIASKTNNLLFFTNIEGKKAVMNVTADRAALALALGVKEEEMLKKLSEAKYNGKIVENGTLTTEPVDLDKIPIFKHYPLDAGDYVTAGVVFSRYGSIENASIHRMLKLDKKRLVARLVEGRHTHTLLKKAVSEGKKLPIAITIGTHPLVTYASCCRVPENMELPFAAELLGGEIKTKTLSNGVRVPDAEIVLEGYIIEEKKEEGPFVDITGTYDPVRMQHVIELTGMYCKPDPIYHGILPAGEEHKLLMGAPYEPLIYRAVAGVTGVLDVVLTSGGCGYLHAVVQIKKRTQGDAKNAIMAAFAAHTSLKHVVVVDEDINPADLADVEYAIATRVRADRDLMVISGVRGSSLDPTRIGDGMNVKMGIDATMELGREDEYIRAEWD